jgi:hypothetical protein
MVRITRLLTFEQYVASTRLIHFHTTLRRKFAYVTFFYITPPLSCLGILFAIYKMIQSWQTLGDGGEFVVWLILLWFSCCFVHYPFAFRKKLRKLYREQELGMPWTLEVSDEGVRSIRPGRSDTRFEWGYFDGYIDDWEFFCLVRSKRLAFVSISKSELATEDFNELMTILPAHLSLLPKI